MAANAELILDARAELGEGAIWHGGFLWWVDILRCEVHRLDPSRRIDRGWNVGEMVGTVVPRRAGGLMLGLHHGFARFTPGHGAPVIVASPEGEAADVRFNDGKCDPSGRLWAGTMNVAGEPRRGNLWRLDADGSVHRMLFGVSVSNGIAWNGDEGVMYYIDTPTRELAAFDYDRTNGTISNRRVAAVFPADLGHPDGMTIDSEGMLWVAMYGGGCVTRWDPRSGRMLDRLTIPATLATSCAFGGATLGELYITSARTGLSALDLTREPNAGGIFRLRPGAHGVPAVSFAG